MPAALSEIALTTGHAPFVEEARSRGDLYISQPYDQYSKENHDTWRALYHRIHPRWDKYANDHFLNGIQALQLPADRVPKLEDINRRLAPLTGFQARPVSGYVPGFLFFDCLRRREFPPPHTHPARRPHGLPARTRYLPRHRRPRPHAHREGLRRHAGALR